MVKTNPIVKISESYFDFMARNFPVMCSSDEFYFFPRVKKSIKFLNILDSLNSQKIKQDISQIKSLKGSLEKIPLSPKDLDPQIDAAILRQNMSSFLREFAEVKVWQKDPNLYLKVALLGIDQLFFRFYFLKKDCAENLILRASQIPRLLKEAKVNLKKVPSLHRQLALEMAKSSIDYFKALPSPGRACFGQLKEINRLKKKAVAAMIDFKKFLTKLPFSDRRCADRDLIEDILKNSFSYKRSLKEIFEIACAEYRLTIKELQKINKNVSLSKTWQQSLRAYQPDVKSAQGLLKLYANQVKNIKKFLKQKNIIAITSAQDISVELTPEFMIPMRASASYSSPLTNHPEEEANFYISAQFNKTGGNIHNEYIFISAHETYPGHHLLDSIRRNLDNPIRQQTESVLFYEGWASHAEMLINELGYIKNPLDAMVGLKRQAWRAIRAMLDSGRRINKLKANRAAELLSNLGYAPKIVKSMLKHYLLTPGYQLCYTMGKFEIERLKEKYAHQLGLKKFYRLLLEGGQVPFDFIEKKMEVARCKKNS